MIVRRKTLSRNRRSSIRVAGSSFMSPGTRGGRIPLDLPQLRSGLTLYEVLLALTIFVMALSALGQLISVGVRAGGTSRLRTEAVLRCESKLAEIVSGVETRMNGVDLPFDDNAPQWSWSAQSSTATQADLLDLTVSANHVDSLGRIDASFSLRRLLRDPVMFLDAALAAKSESSTSGMSTGTQSGGSSKGSGGSSSGSGTSSGGGNTGTGRTNSGRVGGRAQGGNNGRGGPQLPGGGNLPPGAGGGNLPPGLTLPPAGSGGVTPPPAGTGTTPPVP